MDNSEPVSGKEHMYRVPGAGCQERDKISSLAEAMSIRNTSVHKLTCDNEFVLFRDELEEIYMFLTSEEMPAMAEKNRWPIHHDHCFQRIVLDMTFGDCWYDYVDGRPAYKNMAFEHLIQAVYIAEMIVKNAGMMKVCNGLSLEYRDKA